MEASPHPQRDRLQRALSLALAVDATAIAAEAANGGLI
jgi:hypothetical protein